MTDAETPAADVEIDRVIARIQKLLSRTKADAGTSPEEADTAAQRVQELLTKYNLDMAAVEAAAGDGTSRKDAERIKSEHNSKTRYSWQRDLAKYVASANFCAYSLAKDDVWFAHPDGDRWRHKRDEDGQPTYDADGDPVCERGDYRTVARHVFVGRRANVLTSQLMFDYLVEAIERSLPDELRGARRQSPQSYSWLEGCAHKVCDRLYQRRRDLIQKHDEEQRAAADAARAAWEERRAAVAAPKGLPAHKPTEVGNAFKAASEGARVGRSTVPIESTEPTIDTDDEWSPGDGVAEFDEPPPETGLVLASVYDQNERDANEELLRGWEPGTIARWRAEDAEEARREAEREAAAEAAAVDAPVREETERQRKARERRERNEAEREYARLRRKSERDANRAAKYWEKRDPRLYNAGVVKGSIIGLDPQITASDVKQLKG